MTGRTIRWLLLLAAGLTIAIASVVGTLIWQADSWRWRPDSALTAGLAEAPPGEFERRVTARFPVGTPITVLARELDDQGFVPTDWILQPGGERGAVRDESNFVCNMRARVYWREDGAGRIAVIRGVYREEGCL